MIRVWRIGPRRYSADAFRGIGGLHVDGRWHHADRLIVYTASTLSLAALELLTHIHAIKNIRNLIRQNADIPNVIAQDRVAEGDLPNDWFSPVPLEATKTLGDLWLAEGRSAVLWVPSAVGPGEHNALLNPRHRDFGQIVIGRPQLYRFEPRIRNIIQRAE